MPGFFRTNDKKALLIGWLALSRLRHYKKNVALWMAAADFTKWALPIFLCSIFCLCFNLTFAQSPSQTNSKFKIITSSDGKVSLIIPAGAMKEQSSPVKLMGEGSSSNQITLSSLKKESYQSISSSNKPVLAAVKCRPSGLVFLKPVVLVYTLDKAQVPGTKVELALYDQKKRRLIPQNQTAFVEKDSYTVKFSIRHFSTYVVLKDLVSQGAPIGAGVKIPLPDMLTGSFSHSVLLTIPPGRKGMQPAIALNYRSSNPNSWTGVGFSLNPGYITRSTRLGPANYNDDDTFYFITDGGTTELVRLIDSLYQAKIESGFAKFFKESDDSWRILGKDGSVLKLGQTTESKETSSSGSFSWYLTKVIDNNGNYVSYTYIKELAKTYLSRIDYTGNELTGTSFTNSVEFFTESRDDISSSYISTSKVTTAKRLNRIEAKVDGELVWVYKLDYGLSPDTNRSLIKSITQLDAKEEKSFPAQRFEYQAAK
ncbi:MAG: SpvB/TcaC N-terminal domain-containing protein [Candidatus Omnitrophota bacterium]